VYVARCGNGQGVGRAIERSLVRIAAVLLSRKLLGKLFTHAGTSVSVAKQYNVVPVKSRLCFATERVTVVLADRNRSRPTGSCYRLPIKKSGSSLAPQLCREQD